MSTWQPIETAPKDGTYVLLFYPDYRKKVWVGSYYNNETYCHGKLRNKSEGWNNGADRLALIKESLPTHWMHLPPLPTA